MKQIQSHSYIIYARSRKLQITTVIQRCGCCGEDQMMLASQLRTRLHLYSSITALTSAETVTNPRDEVHSFSFCHRGTKSPGLRYKINQFSVFFGDKISSERIFNSYIFILTVLKKKTSR